MTIENIQVHWLRGAMHDDGKRYQYAIPFGHRIMAVASVTFWPVQRQTPERIGEWRVYIDAVPGDNHEQEWPLVALGGVKACKAYAKMWFPNMPPELEYAE